MKERIQISINPDIVLAGDDIMKVRKIDNFSGLLEILIREEWERLGEEERRDLERKIEAAKLNIPNATQFQPHVLAADGKEKYGTKKKKSGDGPDPMGHTGN